VTPGRIRSFDLSPDRLGVYGASYGGFASLCCMTRLPEYWRAGVGECGGPDLVEKARTVPSTWRRRTADWIGDVTDPADRERLRQASPATYADQIRAPLLLIHGTNDTRVAIGPTDAFHARLVELGKTVTYRRIDGAGRSQPQHCHNVFRTWQVRWGRANGSRVPWVGRRVRVRESR
jgi:dipeptidyl aminopeptidase/acylaminoacyl peptidase